jgi:hypothetical protein
MKDVVPQLYSVQSYTDFIDKRKVSALCNLNRFIKTFKQNVSPYVTHRPVHCRQQMLPDRYAQTSGEISTAV